VSDDLIGNVTLTFKQLSEEKPPFGKSVLIASRGSRDFLIASLHIWPGDRHPHWYICGTDYTIEDEDMISWPTWAYLPFNEEPADD